MKKEWECDYAVVYVVTWCTYRVSAGYNPKSLVVLRFQFM